MLLVFARPFKYHNFIYTLNLSDFFMFRLFVGIKCLLVILIILT